MLFVIAACDEKNGAHLFNNLDKNAQIFTVNLFHDTVVEYLIINNLDNKSLHVKAAGSDEPPVPLSREIKIVSSDTCLQIIAANTRIAFNTDIQIVDENGIGLLSHFKIQTNTDRNLSFRGILTIHNSDNGLFVSVDSFEHDIIAYMMTPVVNKTDPKPFLETMAVLYRNNIFSAAENTPTGLYLSESKRHGLFLGDQFPERHYYEAIKETEGYIVRFRGNPTILFTTEICGGMTSTPDMVWHDVQPQPQYQIVLCDYCLSGNKYQWSNAVSSFSLAETLFDRKGFFDVWISNYYENGRPQYITAQMDQDKKIFTVEEFRKIVTERFDARIILSDWFEITDDEGRLSDKSRGPHAVHISSTVESDDSNVIYFIGWGIGHGVGVCQNAARHYAQSGKNFPEILRYYYPRIELGRIHSD